MEFLGHQTDEAIRDLYRGALAVVLPGEEDFGIVPVEAQACGRPVVALARGGALETVRDGVTGVLVADATAEAFAEAFSPCRGGGSTQRDSRARRDVQPGAVRASDAAGDRRDREAPEGTRW